MGPYAADSISRDPIKRWALYYQLTTNKIVTSWMDDPKVGDD